MKRTIIFSKNAEKSLFELFKYLEIKWSKTVKNKFISNLDKVIYLIQSDPEIFPKSELNIKYRKCVLSKQQSIINSTQKE
ncbi:type II toxin-antitoxin system RelE/ParE family toxin [Flavobacterium sp.]|uniref:type II toxin-antitoxin system RelE/ParE family toxin n=1 Tax=Flavobacterium sp. TaxID=239 RepID=UPI00374D937A